MNSPCLSAPAARPVPGPTCPADVPAAPDRRWTVPALPDSETHQQAYRLLGPAWHSLLPSTVTTADAGFEVVQAPRQYAAAAVDRLRALGTRIGAVYTDGTNWRFFTPPETHTLSWPPPVLCLSGPVLPIPPRAARGP
ncbi:hypothetical protein GTY54_37945, partial [Streptomyces sp. SID625]|nr:hypothetical protein [Streptomyces sp. SID625]